MTALARALDFVSRPGNRSVWGVLAVTAVALLLGGWLRSAVLGATRQVAAGGVVARVPADWLVQQGVGELAFTARSASGPVTRYSVSRLSDPGGIPLDDLAADRAAARDRGLDGHRLLREGADQVDGRTAYRVDYAYVEDGSGRIPTVLVGREEFVRSGEDVLVLVLEAEDQAFEAVWEQFEPLIRSVTLSGGEAAGEGEAP
jgi:hypothetical protein